jgi:phage tail-like protein
MPKTPRPTLRGIDLLITDPVTGAVDVDSAWETCLGGAVNVVAPEVASREAGTTSPGHKYVDTLVLRGPLTAGRKALCQWITEVAQGKDSRRSVTIREMMTDGTIGKTYTYLDCFPVRWEGPTLDAEKKGELTEEVHIKPIRLELS